MTINKAIQTLDAVIPPHTHKTVDREHMQIALAWEAIKESLKQTRWIPVTERLPQLEQPVLILDRRGNIMVRTLRFLAGEKEPSFRPDGLVPQKHITHWMPLPEQPKEEKR